MSRKGFTLVELLVVIIVIGVLLALLLPTHRGSREASRRMQCSNNMKQLCLGLQNYHDTFLYLPYGARHRTSGAEDEEQSSWGSSWLVATLPFCEQRPLFDKLMRADAESPANDYQSSAVRNQAHNAKIKYMICPSSALPEMQTLGGLALVLPSYAGIMGAGDHKSTYVTQTVVDAKGRIILGPYGGLAAGNGALPLNESLAFDACSDGTANTIIVGEVADWYYNDAGQKFNPGLSSEAGWIAGTHLSAPVRAGGSAIPADRVFNLITIEHPVGINNRNKKNDEHPNWETQGIGPAGLNNPLLAAHPAGAMVGYLDGHVQLITKQTNVFILKALAQRDDGGMVPDF
jgi:prepilin-type N-terminal cleavage/methylation domain-containing protein/prepilin-type processing-associated H-X9-DG protein